MRERKRRRGRCAGVGGGARRCSGGGGADDDVQSNTPTAIPLCCTAREERADVGGLWKGLRRRTAAPTATHRGPSAIYGGGRLDRLWPNSSRCNRAKLCGPGVEVEEGEGKIY